MPELTSNHEQGQEVNSQAQDRICPTTGHQLDEGEELVRLRDGRLAAESQTFMSDSSGSYFLRETMITLACGDIVSREEVDHDHIVVTESGLYEYSSECVILYNGEYYLESEIGDVIFYDEIDEEYYRYDEDDKIQIATGIGSDQETLLMADTAMGRHDLREFYFREQTYWCLSADFNEETGLPHFLNAFAPATRRRMSYNNPLYIPPEYEIKGYHYHQYTEEERLMMASEKRIQNKLFFGIELETSFSRDPDGLPIANKVANTLKHLNKSFFPERDGTIAQGAELISVPMTYAFITSKRYMKRLGKAMKQLQEYKSTNGEQHGIGLHIHVSKDFFTDSKEKSREGIEDDLNWIFWNAQQGLKRIARRDSTSYCRYPKEEMQERNFPPECCQVKVSKELAGKLSGHRYALNFNRCDGRTKTYEFRIFNSTKDLTELLGTIEFVRNVCHFVKNEKNIYGKSLSTIINYMPAPNLKEMIKKLKIDAKVLTRERFKKTITIDRH